jgi:hypothetical protein
MHERCRGGRDRSVFALSSTAVVLRLLTDRAELDSQHGRNAVGILPLQDIAVVPPSGNTSKPAHETRQDKVVITRNRHWRQ